MSQELTTTSIKTLLKFPFKGRDWRGRFLIGTLLYLACFVPILGLAAGILIVGYVIQVMRRASKGEELTMPAWDDWGGMLKDGLQGLVVQIVYMLPGLVVFYGGMFLYFVAIIGSNILIPFMGSENGDPTVGILFILLFFGSFAIMFLSMAVGGLLMILGMVPLPMALAHFSAQGKVSAAFRVREWWPLLRANKLGYFIAWVIVAGVGAISYLALMPLYLALSFTFFLLPFLMFFVLIILVPLYLYLSMVGAAVFGRTYWESVALVEASGREAER
ncbi:MAG: DUF4013 domain-containing protein [Anaerolineae bacterium]|nr:DUF4013 domain-containing protein [Anaerolineae bacterium]